MILNYEPNYLLRDVAVRNCLGLSIINAHVGVRKSSVYGDRCDIGGVFFEKEIKVGFEI